MLFLRRWNRKLLVTSLRPPHTTSRYGKWLVVVFPPCQSGAQLSHLRPHCLARLLTSGPSVHCFLSMPATFVPRTRRLILPVLRPLPKSMRLSCIRLGKTAMGCNWSWVSWRPVRRIWTCWSLSWRTASCNGYRSVRPTSWIWRRERTLPRPLRRREGD